MSLPETGTLLHVGSPYGNLDAIVEQDGRTVYFYLQGSPAFGTRACWVANLQSGPLEFSLADLQHGQPPLLPRVHCIDPRPTPLPDTESLQVVWFEAGDGAALLQNGQPVAVIPPWSGLDGFHGYARNCASENRICWPMPVEELTARIRQAQQFWQGWIDRPHFREWQPAALAALEKRFGPVEQYFSIDGGSFPPRGLALLHGSDGRVLVTVGMSLCPQPTPLSDGLPPNWHPHVELGLRPPSGADGGLVRNLAGRISSLAAIPWQNQTWIGAGHTCELLKEPPECECAVVRLDGESGSDGPPAWRLPAIPLSAGAPPATESGPRLLWLEPQTRAKAIRPAEIHFSS